MSELDKTEALTKGGLLAIGALLITEGLDTLRRGDARTGLILIGLGVVCFITREVAKPLFDRRRNGE